PARRREYAALLARVGKKPATPWTYWGFRPPPRPAHSVAWEGSRAIEKALDGVLAGADRELRLAVLHDMLREKIPASTATLGRWLAEERQPETVATLLAALRDRPGDAGLPYLEAVLRDKKHTKANRLLAASLYLQGLDAKSEAKL